MLECAHCGARCAPENVNLVRPCTSAVGHNWIQEKDLARTDPPAKEAVDHPPHYGGAENVYEAIKVIDAWGLGFCLGNTVKYIARAGKKDPKAELEDLKKSLWYLQHRIEQLKKEEKK